MKRILTLVLVAALWTSGCSKQSTQQAKSASLTEITICQWGQVLAYLPLYIAQNEGLFEKQGLKVKLINGGADDLTWAAVTTGNAQFGVADPTMVAVQQAQGGVPGKVVGDVVGKVAFWAITLDKKQAEIREPAQFRGQRVAAFKYPNTANALALDTFKKGGLTVGKDVELIEVNYGAVLAQLQGGGATLAMVLEPTASELEQQGAKVVYSYPKIWGDFAFTGLTVTEKYAAEHPEIVQKVVNALQEALTIAHSDLDRTVKDAQTSFPDTKPDILRTSIKRMLDDGVIPASIAPSRDGWLQALQLCVEVKKLEAMPKAPLSYLDESFAKKAIK